MSAEMWLTAARDNLEASLDLIQAGRCRSAGSRAYYAAHHGAHAALLAYGEVPPSRGNWRHRDLPGLLREAIRRRSTGNPKTRAVAD